MPLDGLWQIEESREADDQPATFRHKVVVPGLVNLAQPPFDQVDDFDTRAVLSNKMKKKLIPEGPLPEGLGVYRNPRNYFWYETTFQTPARKQLAFLKINKAQFGVAVWCNGHKVGEHLHCFTAAQFNLTDAIDWQGENRLVIRIGAHPLVLPESVFSGSDTEKNKWTPGLYDRVSLLLCDDPVIETVQVAPRIAGSEITIQTKIRNFGAPKSCELVQRVRTYKGGKHVVAAEPQRIELDMNQEKTVTQTLPIPNATLWSPDHPFLYVLETSTGGDSTTTRFGMREFQFKTADQRAYLNGEVIYLRGSNVTLHRFFEDPNCGARPWDEAWVRKLLAEIPKTLHWNSFRFCIGPVPDLWLDIADEAGLLIQNEYFVWGLRQVDTQDLIRQYSEWMRDNWNHPSVVIWDACNETIAPVLGEQIIPVVRGLDLSHRPWENGYNPPVAPDDPVENHPYEGFNRNPALDLTDLESSNGFRYSNNVPKTDHAQIINEYGWLWLNRDGSGTELTRHIYAQRIPGATADQRFEYYARTVAGITEYWRAHRRYAGVLHFVYLTSSFPAAFTSDNFRDIRTLELEPHFADYMRHAFDPLGVYLNFWQPTLAAGSTRKFQVMMVNDEYEPAEGTLVLSVEDAAGKELTRRERPFALAGLGQASYEFELTVPDIRAEGVIRATAQKKGEEQPTISRRRVTICKSEGTSNHKDRAVFFDEIRAGNAQATYADVAPGIADRAAGKNQLLDLDLTQGPLQDKRVRVEGGQWDNGWRVVGDLDRIFIDLGHDVRNGYCEVVVTRRGSLNFPERKRNWMGLSGCEAMHQSPGGYARAGDSAYAFSKAEVFSCVQSNTIAEKKFGAASDWVLDDKTPHIVRAEIRNSTMTWTTDKGAQVSCGDEKEPVNYFRFAAVGGILDRKTGWHHGSLIGLRVLRITIVDYDQTTDTNKGQ
jgi:hypothetical protein